MNFTDIDRDYYTDDDASAASGDCSIQNYESEEGTGAGGYFWFGTGAVEGIGTGGNFWLGTGREVGWGCG